MTETLRTLFEGCAAPSPELLAMIDPLAVDRAREAIRFPPKSGMFIPALLDCSDLPDENITGFYSRTSLERAYGRAMDGSMSYADRLALEASGALYNILPARQIRALNIQITDRVLAPGEGFGDTDQPHLASSVDGFSTGFTARAATPLPDLYYRDLAPRTLQEARHAGHDCRAEFAHQAKSLFPGELIVSNNQKFIEASPRNDRSKEEWREFLKGRPGHEKLLRVDGSVRCVSLRMGYRLDLSWMSAVHREAMKLKERAPA